MNRKITIDGSHFNTLEEFYDEIDKLLTKDISFRTGHNMDAFCDLLYGGFGVHEPGESLDFYWLHTVKSRRDFGYEATAAFWEKALKTCHPTAREHVQSMIHAAKKHTGETLFDILVNAIRETRSDYHHRLYLDDTD